MPRPQRQNLSGEQCEGRASQHASCWDRASRCVAATQRCDVRDRTDWVGAPEGTLQVAGELLQAAALHCLPDQRVDAERPLVQQVRVEIACEELGKDPTMWICPPHLCQDVAADVQRRGVRIVEPDRVEDICHGDRVTRHVVPQERRIFRAASEPELSAVAPGTEMPPEVHAAPRGRGEVFGRRPIHDPAVVRHDLRVLTKALARLLRKLQAAEVARNQSEASVSHRPLPGLHAIPRDLTTQCLDHITLQASKLSKQVCLQAAQFAF
mmetsp:Transcript_27278/g.88006  ORF Transcript_27278/g.88006 Transcript_27278/m.88006 type:complete len:267 (-) Transcript_27278:1151-1951(-)